ncbi:DUF4123 domain-containing protein [Azohydromonas lata]|uniref:DUF4123 domain-containing protein n=1 Tax=Azohydromonas lata TaxID=45677 RepID=A0ABU5ICQ2_9BURK|nr:DUF4123 domain-containing protein [Azohydromonas lata]MDZ5456594.1 DUF4123 domain-containing protein [Azohydromonas lata]
MQNSNTFMEAVLNLSPGTDSCLYALVDHAGAPGLLKRLHDYPTTPWVNLFTGSREELAIEAAPLLLTLQPPLKSWWLPWLHTACLESTSLTLLYSSINPQILVNGLKKRLDVMLPDDVPALLRYFDTRILESLLKVLKSEQRKSFLGIALRWMWLDRGGNLRTDDTVPTPEDSWVSPSFLSEQQQNTMIEAADADVLMQQMQTHGWDLCATYSRAQLHELAYSALANAKEFGIEGMPSQTLFALACLQLGLNFTKEAKWAALLHKVRNKEIIFEDAIQQTGI